MGEMLDEINLSKSKDGWPGKSVGYNFRDKKTGRGAKITREEMGHLVDILRPIYDRGIELEINYSEIPWTSEP